MNVGRDSSAGERRSHKGGGVSSTLTLATTWVAQWESNRLITDLSRVRIPFQRSEGLVQPLTQYRGRLQRGSQSIAMQAPDARPRAPCGARGRSGNSQTGSSSFPKQ